VEEGSIGINLRADNPYAPALLDPCTKGSPALRNPSLQRYFDATTGLPNRDDTFIMLVGIEDVSVEQARFEDVMTRLRRAPRPLTISLRVYEPESEHRQRSHALLYVAHITER